jgi:FkbM family methyltransferase
MANNRQCTGDEHVRSKYAYYAGSIVNLLTRFRNPVLIGRIFTGLAGKGTHDIQLRGTGEIFMVRVPMDVWSVKETFIDRFYERYGFPLQPGWTIVDIGAAIGEFTVFAAKADSRNTVIACEPFPGSVDLLRENILANQLTNVQVVEKAVAGSAGMMVLDLSGGDPLQFEGVGGAEGADQSQRITVEAISLADIVAMSGKIDLLKLDCEGAEYDILMKAPPASLGAVARVVMEYHDLLTAHTHRDLETFLRASGFTVSSIPNVARPDEIGYLWATRG